ncbi:MAG: YihY/virulence factor BrkB family protein [Thermomicrobiales bacterium]
MQLNDRGLVSAARDLIKSVQRNEIQVTAAAMAYTALFALVPLLIFLAALSGFISRWIGADNTVETVMNFMFRHLPDNTVKALEEPIDAILRRQTGSLLSVGAVLAVWGSRSLINSGMRAINKAYGVQEQRGFVKKNVISLGLTVGLGMMFVIGSGSVLLGSRWGDRVADKFGAGEQFADFWIQVRWPLIGILLLIALIGYFRIAPATPTSIKLVFPGAAITIVGWAVAIFGISFYFTVAGSWAAAYGVLGGLLAFVFWLYVMSLVFAFAAEFNALLYRRSIKTPLPPTAVP